ncbi:MAG: class I SAM-dependent methyltransferase [Phycisphaerales bacterium]|nr:class I SAM-dependent methyltransferase [Phycisphaerales bacterium]
MLTTTHPPVTADDFETIYADARGDATQVPWADGRPHPALVTWLNAIAPSLVRCGARVAVVGCGLGDDAVELIRRGYDVTAFDCSPTAIEWAQRRFPAHGAAFSHADLFSLPTRWHHRFDLVVEINTVQALPPTRRGDTLHAIANLLSPRGMLLVICRARQDASSLDAGPPWPLTEEELLEAAAAAGLAVEGEPCTFRDSETPPVLRTRALFRRATRSL